MLNKMYGLVVNENIATEEELDIILSINGENVEAINSVVYYKTGYHTIGQYMEENYMMIDLEDYEEELLDDDDFMFVYIVYQDEDVVFIDYEEYEEYEETIEGYKIK